MKVNGKVLVVGDDFSPMGDDAILEGLQLLACGVASALHVVHAHDVGDEVGESELLTLEKQLLQGTPEAMARRVHYLAVMSSLAHDPARVHTHAHIGKPVQLLLDKATQVDADLMIVGTQGRSGVARWLMGSVAEALVRKARCPVLVARPKAHRGADDPLPASYYASRPAQGQEIGPAERAHVAATISEG